MHGVTNSVPARNTPNVNVYIFFYTVQYWVESVLIQISYFRFYGNKNNNLSRSTYIMIPRKFITNQAIYFFYADEEQPYFMSCFIKGVKLVCNIFFHIRTACAIKGNSLSDYRFQTHHTRQWDDIHKNSNFFSNEKYHYWNITTYGDSPSKIIKFG